MGAATKKLHPDFGPAGTDQPIPYGIPYIVVPATHTKVSVRFDFADESDAGPYPFGSDTPIEGGPNAGGDRHAVMIDKDACQLYEMWDSHFDPSGSTAGSGAIWDLRKNDLRPKGWTSADAAGLPIFPGLLRRDEVAAGVVSHAIRFTAARTDRSFLWPARHQAGAANDPNLPPMGARFRLKSGFNITGFRPDTRVVLQAMQRYGMILADNGSDWFFQGTSEDGWDTSMLDELKSIPAAQFEAVDESSLMVDENSGQAGGSAPTTTTTVVGQTTTTTAPANTDPVDRLAGEDRLATSVAISQASWPSGQAQTAVLARADAFPDALGGTPLAAEKGGPLLLTPGNALDGRVDAELRRAAPPGATVYLLGGQAALSEPIADTLRNEGFNPVRISGANRFATAVAIASQGLGDPPTAVLVTGTDFPDALSAGAASRAIGNTGPEAGPAARPAAVLLTAGSTMPPETAQWLSAHPPVRRFAVGGAASAADPGATRIAGQDRYETAQLVADQFFPSPAVATFASGASFADALSGGAHALKLGAPLLLTAPTALPSSTQGYLTARKASIARGVIYGGLAAVSSGVANSIAAAIT